jgi:hypothetical protein
MAVQWGMSALGLRLAGDVCGYLGLYRLCSVGALTYAGFDPSHQVVLGAGCSVFSLLVVLLAVCVRTKDMTCVRWRVPGCCFVHSTITARNMAHRLLCAGCHQPIHASCRSTLATPT